MTITNGWTFLWLVLLVGSVGGCLGFVLGGFYEWDRQRAVRVPRTLMDAWEQGWQAGVNETLDAVERRVLHDVR